jgi:glycosyltransferase involved in cell wall biosynthesis
LKDGVHAETEFARWRAGVEAGQPDDQLCSALMATSYKAATRLSKIADEQIAINQPTVAIEHLNEALMLSQDNPWLLFQMGRAVLANGDVDTAVEIFCRGLGQTECEPINTILSQLTDASDSHDQMVKCAKQKISSAEDLVDAGEWQLADTLLRDANVIRFFPEISAIKRADIAITLGRLDLAGDLLSKADKHAPRNPWVSYLRGRIAVSIDDLDAAIAYVEKAISFDPDNNHFKSSHERWSRLAQADAADIIETHIPALPVPAPASRSGHTKVICWDVSHNPAGRAAVLAEVAAQFTKVDLVGPSFSKTQEPVWRPLAQPQPGYGITYWISDDFGTFVNGAIQYVMNNPADQIWVCKARFPSLFVGWLYKLIHGANLTVDIDDDELAFVDETMHLTVDEALAGERDLDWTNPAAASWGRLAQHMVTWADNVTCCNKVLQNQHGGEIIPHVRRSESFAALKGGKAELRAEFDIDADDKVILFMGTPRRHKGILDIARAVVNLSDPKALLLIVGSFPEPDLKKELSAITNLRWRHVEDQPFSSVPRFNTIADLACAMQHTENRIAQSQTPAKLSDAAGTGTLAITSNLDTVEPFLRAGTALTFAENEDLVDLLRRGLAQAALPETESQIKTYFANSLTVASAVPTAQATFQQARDQSKDLNPQFVQLLRLMRRRLPLHDRPVIKKFWKEHVAPPKRPVSVTNFEDDLDIVFFWKQNDTGIYQRRQDSIHEALASLPNVRNVLHIDAPISVDRLMSPAHGPDSTSEGLRVTEKTLARFLRVADKTNIHYRSFVYKGRTKSLLGQPLPAAGEFAAQVARWMEELDIGSNALAWVCPVVPEFDKVQKIIQFQDVVCDVIDDQRFWPMRAETRRSINVGYANIFQISTCVFANCEPVVEWLRDQNLAPVLVPNGLSAPNLEQVRRIPSYLRQLSGPIVGYVGNMSDRIDWDLVHEIATAQPDWQFVFIGKAPANRTGQFQLFADLPNVSMPGVVPAEQIPDWLAGMDVAIIPHLSNRLSEAMNPLKLYVYRTHGMRTVSTPVKNIGDFRDEIAIADNASDMRLAIARAIKEKNDYGPAPLAKEHLNAYNWDTRVAKMISVMRNAFTQSAAPE